MPCHTEGVGTIVVTNIDLLQQPRKFLWQLCDDDTAPHKQAVVLLAGSEAVLRGQSQCKATQRAAQEHGIKDFFRGLWSKNGGANEFDPLWVRVANVAFPWCS